MHKQARGGRGRLGGLDEAWGELVPRELAGVCRAVKLTPGGLLTVRADDASVMYEMDQWLRSGGLAVLRAACSVGLKRVKVVV